MNGWRAYNFLDDDNVKYNHEVHISGYNWNFGFDSHSTPHIEGVWGTLKDNIKKIYYNTFEKFYIIFKGGWNPIYIMNYYSNKEKENKLIGIFEYLYNTVNFDLYDLEEIEDPF